MKAMKKKVRGRKWQVLKGTRTKTQGGLTKTDLIKNKRGKVVSRKQSQRGKQSKWMKACSATRVSSQQSEAFAHGPSIMTGTKFLWVTKGYWKNHSCINHELTPDQTEVAWHKLWDSLPDGTKCTKTKRVLLEVEDFVLRFDEASSLQLTQLCSKMQTSAVRGH